MTGRSSIMQARLRRLTMALGVLGAVGVGVALVLVSAGLRDGGLLPWLAYYVGFAIPGGLPFVLVSLGRPQQPIVSLSVCLVLLGVNSYYYVFTFLSDSSTRGLNVVTAVLYSWVIWGVGMAADNWRREGTPPLAPPPRPDRD